MDDTIRLKDGPNLGGAIWRSGYFDSSSGEWISREGYRNRHGEFVFNTVIPRTDVLEAVPNVRSSFHDGLGVLNRETGCLIVIRTFERWGQWPDIVPQSTKQLMAAFNRQGDVLSEYPLPRYTQSYATSIAVDGSDTFLFALEEDGTFDWNPGSLDVNPATSDLVLRSPVGVRIIDTAGRIVSSLSEEEGKPLEILRLLPGRREIGSSD